MSEYPEGTLMLIGRRPILARVTTQGSIESYDGRAVPTRGRRRLEKIADPGDNTEPRRADEWVRSCGGQVDRYLVHTAWKRFLRILRESDAPPSVLDEDGVPYNGLPKAETLISLAAPTPSQQTTAWRVFDPFSRCFSPVGVDDDSTQVALFHERLSRELLIPGPVLVVLEGRLEANGADDSAIRARPVSPSARRFARALLGAYARRRGSALEELRGADEQAWQLGSDIHLAILDPANPGARDAAARLAATRMRWSCWLREHAPVANREWAGWLRLLAGQPRTGGSPDLSAPDHALITEASHRLRQAEIVASTANPEARAGGSESEEHLACKAAIVGAFARQRWQWQVEFFVRGASADADRSETADDETPIEAAVSDSGDSPPAIDAPPPARIDIVAGPKRRFRTAVEVETCRGSIGQDPFAQVLRRLVRKSEHIGNFDRFELVAPPGLAALAPRPFVRMAAALKRHVSAFSVATVDLGTGDRLELEAEAWLDDVPQPIAPIEHYASMANSEEVRLTWDDIAGYQELRSLVEIDVLRAFHRADELRERGLGLPGGVLMFGPPGTGKTRLARALSNELGHRARVLRPSDFISRWLGEGVERIREIADWAAQARPAVLVIDELDAIAPSRSDGNNVHQDTLAMVNELLTQLDRLRELPDVLVVATTNAMSRLDAAVMRAGRFDFKLPVGPPNRVDREAILSHYLKQHEVVVSAALIDSWVDRTHLLVPADIAALVQQAARRQVLDAESPPFADLMERSLAAWSAPDEGSLQGFVGDLEKYAGPKWKELYAWVVEAMPPIRGIRLRQSPGLFSRGFGTRRRNSAGRAE